MDDASSVLGGRWREERHIEKEGGKNGRKNKNQEELNGGVLKFTHDKRTTFLFPSTA